MPWARAAPRARSQRASEGEGVVTSSAPPCWPHTHPPRPMPPARVPAATPGTIGSVASGLRAASSGGELARLSEQLAAMAEGMFGQQAGAGIMRLSEDGKMTFDLGCGGAVHWLWRACTRPGRGGGQPPTPTASPGARPLASAPGAKAAAAARPPAAPPPQHCHMPAWCCPQGPAGWQR